MLQISIKHACYRYINKQRCISEPPNNREIFKLQYNTILFETQQMCTPTYMGNVCVYRQCTARPIWTNECSERVITHKDLPIVGLNDVPLNFWSQSPKTKISCP